MMADVVRIVSAVEPGCEPHPVGFEYETGGVVETHEFCRHAHRGKFPDHYERDEIYRHEPKPQT